MSTYAKLSPNEYVGVDPAQPGIVYHQVNRPGAPGLWEQVVLTLRDAAKGWYDLLFKAANVQLRVNQQTGRMETKAAGDFGGWGGVWAVSQQADGSWIAQVPGYVTLQLEGFAVVQPLHLEQRGNDFVDAAGNRTSLPGADGFDDLWFRTQGRETELDALMRESQRLKFKVRRIWCMGDAGENQVFSLYPQNVPGYFDMVRGLVAYENSYGIIPLLTACVDAQRVMPDPSQSLGFWRDLSTALVGSGSYLLSVVNQWEKNLKNVRPSDFAAPGGNVIWSRGSDTDDIKTSPDGNGGKATASELHATRNSFDRALMDATASPPNMRAAGSGMVWMTEGNPFGDANGYDEFQAWQLGRVYATCWALGVFHNRQGQRGQLMADDTARRAEQFTRGYQL